MVFERNGFLVGFVGVGILTVFFAVCLKTMVSADKNKIEQDVVSIECFQEYCYNFSILAGTSVEEIALPKTVEATITKLPLEKWDVNSEHRDNMSGFVKKIIDVPVLWYSKEQCLEKPGIYIITCRLPDGYTYEGSLPKAQITVLP